MTLNFVKKRVMGLSKKHNRKAKRLQSKDSRVYARKFVETQLREYEQIKHR